jgi:hypothetical protein
VHVDRLVWPFPLDDVEVLLQMRIL